MFITEAMKKALWLKDLLTEINKLKEPVVVYSNSQGAINLCKNLVFHERTKYINVKLHFIKDVMMKWPSAQMNLTIAQKLH